MAELLDRHLCSRIICVSSSCRPSCANMKKSPPRPRAKVLITSAPFYVSPSSNSSIAKGAWWSAASRRAFLGGEEHVRLCRHSIARQAARSRTRALRVCRRPRQCRCSRQQRHRHACLAPGLAACQRGFPVAFFTAAGLVHQLSHPPHAGRKASRHRAVPGR